MILHLRLKSLVSIELLEQFSSEYTKKTSFFPFFLNVGPGSQSLSISLFPMTREIVQVFDCKWATSLLVRLFTFKSLFVRRILWQSIVPSHFISLKFKAQVGIVLCTRAYIQHYLHT